MVPKSEPPTVVFIDSIPWESFCSLAAALRNHGISVARITAHRKERFQRFVQQAERVVFGSTHVRITRPEDTGEPIELEWDSLADLLPSTTIDIQASDVLAAMILKSGDPAERFLRRVGPGRDPMEIIDKWRAKQLLIELGIPVPWGADVCESSTFPIVVKARVGSGGSEVRIAQNREEMVDYWEELTTDDGTTPILEAFHAESRIRFGGVAKDGHLLVGSAYEVLADSHLPLGPARSARAVSMPTIVANVERLVAATNFTGFINLDYVDDVGGEPLANDINPRAFASWSALQRAGIDIVGAYVHALGLGPRPVVGPVDYASAFDLFTFPLPLATSGRELRRRHKAELALVRQDRPIMGNTWALLTIARIESYVVKQAIKRPWRARGRSKSGHCSERANPPGT